TEATEVLEVLRWSQNSHIATVPIAIENENRKVSYVRLQANRVAHDLAQAARSLASSQVYNYCLPCLYCILRNSIEEQQSEIG
ncbi:hypothetical protein A2U01_0041883, partial [Trifolium medium]|nr:hypothetical protein [Trifolium medium]